MNRFASVLGVVSASSLALACNTPPPPPDVTYPQDVPRVDTRPSDGPGVDGTGMDAGPDGSVDSGNLADASLPDVEIMDGGACQTVSSPIAIVSETRMLSRPISLVADRDGFDLGVAGLRDTTEAVMFLSAGVDGTAYNAGPATPLAPGVHVRGGSITPSSEYYLTGYTSDETGADQVFVNLVQNNAIPLAASRRRISMDNVAASDPQVANRTTGFLVAWRETGASGGSVQAVFVSTALEISVPAFAVSEPGADVSTFRLVTSPADGAYSVAYLSTRSGTTELRVRAIDATGAVAASSILVASGADVGTDLDAVASGTTDVLVWNGAAPGGSMHVARVPIDGASDAGAPVVLSQAGGPIGGVGIGTDGTGFAIAYRFGSGDAARLGMLRIASDLSFRDSATLSAAGPGGRLGIGRALMAGRYGIGSADDFSTGTVARFFVVQCPP